MRHISASECTPKSILPKMKNQSSDPRACDGIFIECRLVRLGEASKNNGPNSDHAVHGFFWRNGTASLQAKASSRTSTIQHVPLDFLRRLYGNDDLLLVEFCKHVLSGHVPRRWTLRSPLSIAHGRIPGHLDSDSEQHEFDGQNKIL